mmetsp:Transcript_12675/g.34234  ORF Transcript_12675/g.34234 Transcript_12675/m.34234 type:complete len:399 (+) Transcript_12675:498-1694(+)
MRLAPREGYLHADDGARVRGPHVDAAHPLEGLHRQSRRRIRICKHRDRDAGGAGRHGDEGSQERLGRREALHRRASDRANADVDVQRAAALGDHGLQEGLRHYLGSGAARHRQDEDDFGHPDGALELPGTRGHGGVLPDGPEEKAPELEGPGGGRRKQRKRKGDERPTGGKTKTSGGYTAPAGAHAADARQNAVASGWLHSLVCDSAPRGPRSGRPGAGDALPQAEADGHRLDVGDGARRGSEKGPGLHALQCRGGRGAETGGPRGHHERVGQVHQAQHHSFGPECSHLAEPVQFGAHRQAAAVDQDRYAGPECVRGGEGEDHAERSDLVLHAQHHRQPRHGRVPWRLRHSRYGRSISGPGDEHARAPEARLSAADHGRGPAAAARHLLFERRQEAQV